MRSENRFHHKKTFVSSLTECRPLLLKRVRERRGRVQWRCRWLGSAWRGLAHSREATLLRVYHDRGDPERPPGQENQGEVQVSAGLESSTTTTASSERQGWEPVLAGLAAPGAVGRSASAVPFDDWCLALPITDDHFLERPRLKVAPPESNPPPPSFSLPQNRTFTVSEDDTVGDLKKLVAAQTGG